MVKTRARKNELKNSETFDYKKKGAAFAKSDLLPVGSNGSSISKGEGRVVQLGTDPKSANATRKFSDEEVYINHHRAKNSSSGAPW